MELMDPRRGFEDVLGFTNPTAILLCGMGAKDLVPYFKERNISTEVLAELTVEDLQLLGNPPGADPELAVRMQKELKAISKRVSRTILTAQQRLDQLSEAFVNNNKHLSLIQAFVTYSRLRINKEKIDSFIERNKNLRSSKALEMAVEATICEIQDARLALEELKLILEDEGSSRNRACFYLQLAALGGVGFLTFSLIFRKLII